MTVFGRLNPVFRHRCVCGVEFDARHQLINHIYACGPGHDVDIEANRAFLQTYWQRQWAASKPADSTHAIIGANSYERAR